MIQIYKSTNTNFNNHGDAVLIPRECLINLDLVGAWTLTMSHPLDNEGRWKNLEQSAVIKAPSIHGPQLWRIRNVLKTDVGIEVEADPIFLDAREDCFLRDIRPTNANGQAALSAMLAPNNKYSASSNIRTEATAYFVNRNFIDCLAGDSPNFIERWGGEILYNNFEIIVNDRVGGDYGVKILYGKNILGISETVNIDEVTTRIYPFAYNGRTLAGNTPYVDSPNVGQYPIIHARKIEYPNIKLLQDVTGENPEEGDIICNTLTELRQALTTAANLDFQNGVDSPDVCLEIDIALLQNTTAYKDYKHLESVSLGDTVHCRHARLGITSDARVVALTYNAITKGVVAVTLASTPKSFFATVAGAVQRIGKAIRPDGTVKAEEIQGFINGALTQLRLQNTIAEKQDVRAILFEDLDPNSPTFGALSIGTQGLQISRERTPDDLDWVWTTAATSEGIIANTIIAQDQLAVAKHFFADSGGVHVTQDEYDATVGRNILINGTTVDVRDGATTLASFGETTVVGKSNKGRTVISQNGTQIYGNDGNTIIADLGYGAGTSESGSSANAPYYTLGTRNGTKGNYSLAQGYDNRAAGWASTAIGGYNKATGGASFASGYSSTASGEVSAVIAGSYATASGGAAIATGARTVAQGTHSFAQGYYTRANGENQVVIGQANVADTTSAFIIGNGDVEIDPLTGTTVTRRNALSVVSGFNPTLNLYIGPTFTSPYDDHLYNEISFNRGFYSGSYIRSYAQSDNGSAMLIRPGGPLIAGGGEFASNLYDALGQPQNEATYIGADSVVYIMSNGNTISDRKTWTFNTNGNILLPAGGNVGPIQFGTNLSSIVLGGTETTNMYLYGTSNNKVGIGAYNNSDNKRYDLQAKDNQLQLYNNTDSTTVWSMTPASVAYAANGQTYNAVSCNTATWTKVAEFTLDAGVYIVHASARFARNSTGDRALQIAKTAGANDPVANQFHNSKVAIAAGVTPISVSTPMYVSATTTYYINAYQDSGAALNCTPRFSAIRVI